MNLAEGLNREQVRAMTHDQGPALVIAGAGTGKTTVIARRIAWLVQEKKAKPEEILAVTFTDKAASEMEERVDMLLPYGVVETNIMTFHSLGERILRDNAFELGLASDFRIMNGFSQALFIQELIEGLELNYYSPLGNPYSFVGSLISHFSKLKDEAIAPADYSKFALDKKRKAQSLEDKAAAERTIELSKIYEAYTKEAYRRGWLDFGDLIVLVNKLFSNKPHILEYYREKYKYLLVDEYQDTNTAQAKIINMLSKKHQNLFVVGDDDQSIYRFRGASISNIMQFTQDYPKAKRIVLKKNYRSSQQILDAAYRLINHNNPERLEAKYQIDKHLEAQFNGVAPIQKEFDSLPNEMEYVADKVASYIKKGIPPKDIAILLRKNNQAGHIRLALDRARVAYQQSQSNKLFDRAEIKAIANFTHILNDPADDRSLFGLMIGDIYNIDMSDVVNYASLSRKTKRPLIEIIQEKETDKKITQVLSLLESFRKRAADLSAGQLLYDFLIETRYLDRLKNESDKDTAAALKIQNIAKFFNLVREFETSVKDPNIYNFWRHLDDIITTESVDITAEESPLDQNAVQIMTVHRAKGLEFTAVFMIDLCNQTFPLPNMPDKIPLDDGLIRLPYSKDWHMSEERRLFYVGMTRAKQYLHLTNARDHGGKRLKKISPFVIEAIENVNSTTTKPTIAAIKHLENFALAKPMAYDPVATLYHDGWLHLSTNQISDYIRSPQDFWLFDILNLPKSPFHALVYGSAVHAAIEFYYKSKINQQPVSLKKLYEVFEKAWSNEGFVSLTHEERRYRRGKEVIQTFYKREQAKKDYPTEVEKPFHLMLSDLKLRITGRYDAVFERKDGVEIRDFKTGDVDTEKKAAERLKDSIQLSIYALAWEKHTSQPVKNVSLHFVEHNILVKTDKINHNKTLSLLQKVVEGIKKRDFKAQGQSRHRLERLL